MQDTTKYKYPQSDASVSVSLRRVATGGHKTVFVRVTCRRSGVSFLAPHKVFYYYLVL